MVFTFPIIRKFFLYSTNCAKYSRNRENGGFVTTISASFSNSIHSCERKSPFPLSMEITFLSFCMRYFTSARLIAPSPFTSVTSVISTIVAIADALSASRPGARNDSLENYVQRLTELENIGNSIEGVEKTYAMQAGRELRVIVKPEQIDDLASVKVARDIKNQIEEKMQYPGTIKVIVIRETRCIEEAK